MLTIEKARREMLNCQLFAEKLGYSLVETSGWQVKLKFVKKDNYITYDSIRLKYMQAKDNIWGPVNDNLISMLIMEHYNDDPR